MAIVPVSSQPQSTPTPEQTPSAPTEYVQPQLSPSPPTPYTPSNVPSSNPKTPTMTETPEVSQYDDNVWQPTISPSDSDYANEERAVQVYQGYYGSAPYDQLAGDTAPKTVEHMVSGGGSAGDSSGSSGSGTLGDLVGEVTDGALAAVGNAVIAIPNLAMVYTEAPDLIPTPNPQSGSSGNATAVDLSYATSVDLADLRSTEQTCLNETSDMVDAYNTLKPLVTAAASSSTIFGQDVTGGHSASGTRYSIYNAEGTDYASSMVPAMESLLQAAGNLIEALGGFNAMLNTAGQMYAETDATVLKHSAPYKR